MNGKNNLKITISEHLKKELGINLNDSELNKYEDNIIKFFKLLIEEDQKNRKEHKNINLTNNNC